MSEQVSREGTDFQESQVLSTFQAQMSFLSYFLYIPFASLYLVPL